MRKLLLSLMAATAATSLAAPASAQWRRPTPVAMQDMHGRVQEIRARVRDLQQHGVIDWRQARHFDYDASKIDQEIWGKSRHGLSFGDRRSINDRIDELRRRVDMAAARGPRRPY